MDDQDWGYVSARERARKRALIFWELHHNCVGRVPQHNLANAAVIGQFINGPDYDPALSL